MMMRAKDVTMLVVMIIVQALARGYPVFRELMQATDSSLKLKILSFIEIQIFWTVSSTHNTIQDGLRMSPNGFGPLYNVHVDISY